MYQHHRELLEMHNPKSTPGISYILRTFQSDWYANGNEEILGCEMPYKAKLHTIADGKINTGTSGLRGNECPPCFKCMAILSMQLYFKIQPTILLFRAHSQLMTTDLQKPNKKMECRTNARRM
jgi:hypothetical protein